MNWWYVAGLAGFIIGAAGIANLIITYEPPQFLDQCVKSHEEQRWGTMPMYAGTVNGVTMFTYIPYQYTDTICDESVKVPNPDWKGRTR